MVKIKTISSYTIFNGQEDERLIQSFLEYDMNGNILTSITYNSEGEIENKVISKFDDKSHKLEELSYVSEDDIEKKVKYFYNDEFEITNEEITYMDGSVSIRKYEHNPKDNSLLMTLKDESDEIEEKEYIKFDEKGNEKEKIIFDEYEPEKIKERHFSEYDENERLIKRFVYGPKEKDLIQERNFSYDEKGNLLKSVILNRRGEIIERLQHKYNEQGKVTETKIGNLMLTKYEYDDENKTMKEERYLGNGELESSSVSKYNEEGLLVEEDHGTFKVIHVYELFS